MDNGMGEAVDDRHTFVANHVNGMSNTQSDGMLSHENEEMKERVIVLEKKVHDQEDELLCLKSALSDVIRRLSAVEANRPFQNNVLPSKPNFRGPTQRRGPTQSSSSPKQLIPMTASRGRSGSLEAVGGSPQRGTSPTPSKIVPRRSPTSPKSLRKWPSVPSGSGSEVTTPNGPLTPTRHSSSLSSLPQAPGRSPFLRQGREPSFCQDDGSLKFYLRGRPVNLYAPTTLMDYDVSKIGQAPDEHLKLEWVYGYRGRDARCNLYQLPTGEMVYFIASTVILYNVEEQMQRHYLGHTDDVKCIAIHPDKITIATGQVAGHDKREGKKSKDLSSQHWPASVARRYMDRRSQPHVRIWDSVSLNTLKVIGIGEFERAVACLGFSKADGGLHLVAIDDGNEHTISVWEWQKGERGHKVTETKSSTEPVLASEFHPCENSSIVTCGKNQISFWTLDGGTLTRKLGVYEKHDKPKFVTCLAFAENGDVLTGDSNGSLFVWGRATNRVLDAVIGAHEGTIFSICVLKDGTLLTGGKDRKIVHWGASYKKLGVEQEIPEQYGAPRMLSQGKGSMILVGTTRNRILQGALGLEFSPIVQGHVDELWGLACHPSQHQFVTCGYDTNLYVWDTLTHSAIWCVDMMEGCHCVAFHPEGNIIAVGCLAAKWLVIDIITRDIISTHIDGMERVECIAYSPDGQSLAIGSRDNNVYLYAVSEGGRKYNRRGRCAGHSSFVTHIDWSVDSQFLQSNSGDYELLFWNAATCHQLTSPSLMRDTEWVSHTCTLGFNVCGVWPEGADGTDVNACCRSNKQKLVASADDFGKVNLYGYPCCQPRSQCHTYGGHSSHVTNVSFLCDDTRLLSTGGKDMAVLQWQIL